jgi:hypothetical protein
VERDRAAGRNAVSAQQNASISLSRCPSVALVQFTCHLWSISRMLKLYAFCRRRVRSEWGMRIATSERVHITERILCNHMCASEFTAAHCSVLCVQCADGQSPGNYVVMNALHLYARALFAATRLSRKDRRGPLSGARAFQGDARVGLPQPLGIHCISRSLPLRENGLGGALRGRHLPYVPARPRHRCGSEPRLAWGQKLLVQKEFCAVQNPSQCAIPRRCGQVRAWTRGGAPIFRFPLAVRLSCLPQSTAPESLDQGEIWVQTEVSKSGGKDNGSQCARSSLRSGCRLLRMLGTGFGAHWTAGDPSPGPRHCNPCALSLQVSPPLPSAHATLDRQPAESSSVALLAWHAPCST